MEPRHLHALCYHVSLGNLSGCREDAIHSTKKNGSASAGPLWNPKSLPNRECGAVTC